MLENKIEVMSVRGTGMTMPITIVVSVKNRKYVIKLRTRETRERMFKILYHGTTYK